MVQPERPHYLSNNSPVLPSFVDIGIYFAPQKGILLLANNVTQNIDNIVIDVGKTGNKYGETSRQF